MARTIACLVVFSALATPNSALAQSKSAREAVQTIEELRAIGVPKDVENGPPARVPKLLKDLNRELRGLITETLNDANRHAVPGEEEIVTELHAAGWNEIADHKWDAYGEILGVKFDWKLGYNPDLLVITTRLWIPCGSNDPDSAVYVFQGNGRQWKLVLAADADFDFGWGSVGPGMQYKISPPDSSGKWFLALARTPPSCRWSPEELRYTVLRPGPTAEKAEVLLDRRVTVNENFDPSFRTRVEENWFAVTRGRKRKLDGELGVSITRFEVDGSSVRRIQPLALTPEDFLEEWVRLDWEEARRWTDSGANEAGPWHERLSKLENDSTEFNGIQVCKAAKNADGTWVVSLWIDKRQNPSWSDENVFFTVSKKDGAIFVDRIQKTPPAGCSVQERLEKMNEGELPDW